MDPRKNVTTTSSTSVSGRPGWGFGTTSGSGIDGCVINVYRFPFGVAGAVRIKSQRGTLDGVRVTIPDYDARYAEVNRLGLLYGYTFYFGRNTMMGFVQSRAARKRGREPANPKQYGRLVEAANYRRQRSTEIAS